MADLAKVGDTVSCPVFGITSIANGSYDAFLGYKPVALVGVSCTGCSCSSGSLERSSADAAGD